MKFSLGFCSVPINMIIISHLTSFVKRFMKNIFCNFIPILSIYCYNIIKSLSIQKLNLFVTTFIYVYMKIAHHNSERNFYLLFPTAYYLAGTISRGLEALICFVAYMNTIDIIRIIIYHIGISISIILYSFNLVHATYPPN